MEKTQVMKVAREAVLWIGGVLGALCLASLLTGWLFNVTPLVFSSGSMSPTYDAGALGIAREVPGDELSVGDVVSVVNTDGDRVTHRIVAIDPAGGDVALTLQGDTNNVPDDETYLVDSGDRVAFGVPYLGYVLGAATAPFGLLAIALIVGTSLYLGFGRRLAEGTPTRRRARMLLPLGVAGTLLAGVTLGIAGQVPWAFTSAYWTDTAAVTATVTTPTTPKPPAPTLLTCVPVTGNIVSITWSWPIGEPNPTGFEVRHSDGSQARGFGPLARSNAGNAGNYNNFNAEIWVVALNGTSASDPSAKYKIVGSGINKTCVQA